MEVYVLVYIKEGELKFARGGEWRNTKIRCFTSMGRAQAAIRVMDGLPEGTFVLKMTPEEHII